MNAKVGASATPGSRLPRVHLVAQDAENVFPSLRNSVDDLQDLYSEVQNVKCVLRA